VEIIYKEIKYLFMITELKFYFR